MSTRPTDWSALGLDTDPTPGDPDQVQDVYNLLQTLSQDYQTIYDTLQTVNGYASSDNLVGQTADALRKQMNGRITKFVESANNAFPQVASAVNTYLTALNAQQTAADALLTQAQNSGLKSDDPQIKAWAAQARQAGSDLESAEDTAAKAVQSAPGPSNPLSPWQEFLEILGWIALLLILPAMVFGGFVALVEFVVNAVLFVNALIQFAEGNLSFGGLLLAALGVIAPTTRALDLGEIVNVIKGIGSSVKTGIVSVRGGLSDFIGLLTSKGLGDLLSVDTLVAIGAFTLKAGVWVFNGLKELPSLVIKGADVFATKLGELITTGVEKLYTSFRTGSFISAFLPVDAAEIEKLGLVAGLRLGFVDRGLSFFPAAHGIGDIAKTGFTGVHIGDLTTNGFGRVTTPHLDAAGFRMPDAATLHTPSLDTNVGKLGFDAHLGTPHLAIDNFDVSLVHSDLGLGKLSAVTPVGFRIGHLEIPDLRTPPELARIGQGTTITHMSDISFVTVHEDLVPQAVHVDAGAIGTPALHTGDPSMPGLHIGDVSSPIPHDANTPDLTGVQLSTGFHAPAIPVLHTAEVTVPTVRLGDLPGIAARPPAAHDLPSLSSVAHTKVSISRPDEISLTHTDTSLTLTTGPQHLADTTIPDAFAHLALPAPTVTHLATDTGAAGLGHTGGAALDIGRSASPGAHLAFTDAGIKGRMDGLDASTEHLGETGRLDPGRLPTAESTAHIPAFDASSPHPEMPAPAVSSAGIDETAAHSAGTPGAHAPAPDLAGKPGLFDPNGERVAVHWTEFKQAQHEYEKAAVLHQQAFPDRDPSLPESSAASADPKGKLPMTPAQSFAYQQLQLAAGGLDDAAAALHALDADPARLAAAEGSAVLDSLRENPRLLGAGWHGDKVMAADVTTGKTLHSTRGLGGSGLRLEIDNTGEREFGRVVELDGGAQVYHGTLTEIGEHGDFRLDDPDTASGFREYHRDGTVAAQGLSVTDHSGEPVGPLRIDWDEGVATLGPHGGAEQRALEFTALEDGGFRLGDPDGSWTRIDDQGRIMAQGIRVTGHDGAPLGVVEVRFATGDARFEAPGLGGGEWDHAGNARGFTLSAADHGALHFDQAGRLVGRDQDVVRFDGDEFGRLEVDYSQRTATLTAPGGHRMLFTVTTVRDGEHLLTDGRSGEWIRVDGDGRTVFQGIAATGHDDARLGVVEIDFAAGRANFEAPGLGGGDWDFAGNARGFTLTGADHNALHFDPTGRLIGRDRDIEYFDGGEHGRLEVDYGGRTATFTALGGHQTQLTLTTVRDGEHLLTDGRTGEFIRVDGDGRTVLQSIRATGHDDAGLGVVEIDFTTGHARFDAPGLGGGDWDFARNARGFTLTGADHNALHFDQTGRLVGRDRDIVHFNGDGAGRLEADYSRSDAILTAPGGQRTAFAITAVRDGEHLLTSGHTGEWIRVDGDGRIVGRSLGIRDHDGAALTDLGLDYRTGQAEFTTPDGAQAQWDFSRDAGGGFTLTRADGHRLVFAPDSRLLEQDVPLHGADAATGGARLHADFAPPNGAVLAVHDAAGRIAHLDVTRTAAGHFVVTDARPGERLGSFSEYDRFAGTVRGGRSNLLDHNGMFVEFDNTGARPAMTLGDADGPIGHLRPTRDQPTGDIVLTDTRGVHDGDTRTYDAQGTPLREHITITTPNGRATGEHFEVDLRTMRWTRNDAAGPKAPVSGRARDGAAGFDAAYNGAGSVTLRRDGTLVLNGEDKTSVYVREELNIEQTLELTRQSNGSRYWTTWDTHGMTGWGRRHFSTESDGVSSWDLGRWGQTLREYRVAIDKGTIRAERMRDGTFSWARYTKDGDLAFKGTREYGLGGWTDKVVIGDETHVAQRKWNAWTVLGRASHYRENAVSANGGVFTLKETYKEISQQAKDAGSKEMTDGHWLEFTRYAEQRPPDFLWKTPENLENPVSKFLARSPLGSRYGAIDFPQDSAFLGDSRFQVFKWTEHDAANGDRIVSQGVRVLTPDGSFSDFAGDGLFVRGAIKLDDGHTVEIGRDAHGKWDTFALNGDARPAGTLNWRELDSAKNVVNEGVRTFHGKQWIDHYTDAEGLARVARHTNPDGTVVHYTAGMGDRPRLDPGRAVGDQVVRTGDEISVTRNTMNQIIGRSDHWGGQIRAAGPLRVTGHGDPRTGPWEWRDANGGHGVRVSGRNTRGTGAWDDSFADFRVNPFTHEVDQIRDLRDLGKGTSLRAERDATLSWRSWKYDARGQVQDGSEGIRQWKQADGSFGPARPSGTKAPAWRDVHPQNPAFTMRELVDGRVREYGDQFGHVWKEYNFGSVWRERSQVPGRDGLYLEKESFQKQWRVTNADGRLIRFRSAAGNVWERDPFGRWSLGSSGGWTKVGREFEDKGLITDFRGWNRRVREPNRFQFKEPGLLRPDAGGGAVGEFVGTGTRLGQKTFLDVLQDFTIDVGANIIIAGASDDWDFDGDAWGRILLGGALRSGIKGIYGVLTETALKGFRDGLRNLDGGKDWNRNPYNNDKHWDNEWGGNENPPRWRANVYDFGVGQVFVPALANFVANTTTAAVFGVGKDDVKLSGIDALKAGGLAMAGSVVGSLSAGAVRTLGHQLFSGRLFHQGGLPDITLQFGEKLFLDYIVNELIEKHSGLEASSAAKGG